MFEDEYNLQSLRKIKQDGFSMYVTPRYLYHYVQTKYEPFSSEIILNYLVKDSTFVDIGAHFGYYSLLANRVSGVKIVAVEPVPTTFKILSKNMKLNKVNCQLHNCAISDKNEDKLLNITEASDSVGFYQHPMTKTKIMKKVKCVTVDALLKDIEKVSFIKIDVEGHEMAVLRGMKSTLKKYPNLYLLVELCPQLQINAGYRPEELIETLDSLGFDTYLINEVDKKYYRLKNNKYSWQELLGVNTYGNIFCVPKKKAEFISFISHTNLASGAERTLLELVSKIKNEGGLAHVILPRTEGPLIEKLKGLAISYDQLDYIWWTDYGNKSDQRMSETIVNLASYLDEYRRINPQVVFTNTSVVPWGALLAKLMNLPHIWSIHEFGDKDHGVKYFLPIAETRKIIDLASDCVIYNSKVVREEYEKIVSRTKGRQLYMDLPDTKPNKLSIKSQGYQDRQSLKLVMVGFMAESKGQDQAVKATLKLLKQKQNVELLLLGRYQNDSQYYIKIQALIGKNLSRIHLVNHVDNPLDYINAADVVLVCSRNEAFGRGAAEGMLLKKPIIISDRGAYKELVQEGVNGYIYKYGNIDDLVFKISKFFEDPKKVLVLGERGRKYALTHFVSNNYAKKIYEICCRLTTNSSGGLTKTHIFVQKFFGEHLAGLSRRYTIEHEQLEIILGSKFYRLWRLYRRIVEKILK